MPVYSILPQTPLSPMLFPSVFLSLPLKHSCHLTHLLKRLLQNSPSLLAITVANAAFLTCLSFLALFNCISFLKHSTSLSLKWYSTSSFSSAYFCPFFYWRILNVFLCSFLCILSVTIIVLGRNQSSKQDISLIGGTTLG